MTPARLVIAAASGAVCTEVAARVLSPALRRGRLATTNYRGKPVISALGICLAAALVAGAVVGLATDSISRAAVVAVAAGAVLGGLGFADDLYGDRSAGGFRGHVRELLRGRVTTGSVKAFGGAVAGLVAAWLLGHRGWRILVAGAVIALSANLVNLFDTRPGRAAKVWLAAVVVWLSTDPAVPELVVAAALAGGVLAWLRWDLTERGMLGDAGANLIGGALGVLVVSSTATSTQIGVLAVLVVLTAASEWVSLGRAIERTPVVRTIDRLGRSDG